MLLSITSLGTLPADCPIPNIITIGSNTVFKLYHRLVEQATAINRVPLPPFPGEGGS